MSHFSQKVPDACISDVPESVFVNCLECSPDTEIEAVLKFLFHLLQVQMEVKFPKSVTLIDCYLRLYERC